MAALISMAALSAGSAVAASSTPVFRDTPGGRQLYINGAPTLLLGGELHNSSPSDPQYMRPIWDKLKAMNVKAVIGGASWQDIEPREGVFDFEDVNAQIAEARARDIKLVLIWFGAFKNASSTYAPSWVRADPVRFPRAVVQRKGKEVFTYAGATPKPVLSVFSPELEAADRRAFTALMRNLKAIDPDHTVVMVQVENESGLLGDSRDRSALADQAWNQAVPAELISYLVRHKDGLRPELSMLWARQGHRRTGAWREVFGADWEAEEVFMAWRFSRYVSSLAAAGKATLNLPMYANAWLGPQPGQSQAGQYPSGGPGARVIDIWKAGAPELDLIAPDVYIPDVKATFADYHRPDNPLFVPEAQFRAGSLFWALGMHRAIGFSAFGIEDGRVDSQYAEALGILGPMSRTIAEAQAANHIVGVLLEDGEASSSFKLGGYDVVARGARELMRSMFLDAGIQPPPPPQPRPSEAESGATSAPGDSRAFGLIIADGPDTFLVAGQGLTLDFSTTKGMVEIDQVEEGRFGQDGKWIAGRNLNGDERLAILPHDKIGVARIRLLRLH